MAFRGSAVSVAQSGAMPGIDWKNFSDKRRDPPKTDCIYRVGPAPREDVSAGTESALIGTLDSDLEDNFSTKTETPVGIVRQGKRAAASKALIIYFTKMASKGNIETIDYRFLDSLFKGGANVNVSDKHGQSVLHEVSRNWNTDVAKYFLERGSNINKGDHWGRTPLHLASAVNHVEMVEFLINNGAFIHAKTTGELQSPIHYAAKYNAVGSLKILLQYDADMNDRDYRLRTPLFIAAEMAREDSARYMIDIGVPVGTFDDTGMSTISHMVEKMPHISVDALDQFLVVDSAFRKAYYYLNFLEYNPVKWREENQTVDEHGVAIVHDKKELKRRKKEKKTQCKTTPLKLAVQLEEFDVIMHPVMQQLIKQKWNKFGKWGAVIDAGIHLFYILIWTILGISLPKSGNYYESPRLYWSIPLEVLGVLLTLYFLLHQIGDRKVQFKEQRDFRMWRTRQLSRDIDYCHPRWAQEKTFLESEMKAVRARSKGVLSDPWNIFDFITLASVLVVICTRVASFNDNSPLGHEIHMKSSAIALIFMWIHFMKSCRPFTTLGPFITMFGHVIKDTITFGFLFFEFFIPYSVGFWILFGGPVNAKIMNKAGEEDDFSAVDWEKFNDLLYSVWQVTLNVDFNMDALTSVNRLMAQIMVGTFFAFSTVLCLNLYIALLSDTFNRVYQNAKANASLLQAYTVCQTEKILPKKKAKVVFDYIQDECGPLITAQAEDKAGFTEEELWSKVIRTVILKFDQLSDFIKGPTTAKPVVNYDETYKQLVVKYRQEKEIYDVYQILMARDQELYKLKIDLYELKCALLKHFGEEKLIPPRPKYCPPPEVDIQLPTPLPKYAPPAPPKPEHVPNNNAPEKINPFQHFQSNDIFRSIMESKSTEGMDVLQKDHQADDDPLLSSDSWEEIPPTEFSDDLSEGES